MYNGRIILDNYSKGSFGNIFMDSQSNIYKMTKISENGILTISNINEIIFFNKLKIIENIFLNEPNLTMNNIQDGNINKKLKQDVTTHEDIKLEDIEQEKINQTNISNTNNNLSPISKLIIFDIQNYKSFIDEKLFMQSVNTKYYDYEKLKNNYVFADNSIGDKYTDYLAKRLDKILLISTLPKYQYNLSKFIEKYQVYVINNFDLIAKKIIKSLAFLHHNGFVHGDLKSANILINDSDNICLTDFGAVKMINFDRYHLSCTISSRCPEDLEYEYENHVQYSNSNFKSDIWSLGIIFTEMILGFNPILKLFQKFEKTSTDYKISENKIHDYFKTIEFLDVLELAKRSTFKVHYSDKIYKHINTINQMLQVDPEKRLNTIEEVYEKLFEEKLVYDLKINYTYDYKKFNVDNNFNVLFNIRKTYYKNIFKVCNRVDILFVAPFAIDLLDRLFINLLDDIIKKKIELKYPNINLTLCSAVILASGLMNQMHPAYKDILILFGLINNMNNVANLNNNMVEILEIMNYDIIRPFNIFYCWHLVEDNNKCKCITHKNYDNSHMIHKEEEKQKLMSILNEIVDNDIIGLSPEYYYEKLKNGYK